MTGNLSGKEWIGHKIRRHAKCSRRNISQLLPLTGGESPFELMPKPKDERPEKAAIADRMFLQEHFAPFVHPPTVIVFTADRSFAEKAA